MVVYLKGRGKNAPKSLGGKLELETPQRSSGGRKIRGRYQGMRKRKNAIILYRGIPRSNKR